MSRSAAVRGIRLPFALSLLGHAVLLALAILFVRSAPPLPLPQAISGIAVTLAPSPPQTEVPPAPPTPPPPAPPPVAAITPPPLPPPPEPPLPETPTVEAPPLPPQKPVIRPVRPPLRRPERQVFHRAFVPAAPQPAPQQPVAARLPAPPAPAATITPGYAAMLGAWLERHKHYPEAARERGEEGRAILQFAVDRSGRVIDFAIVKSTGYPDLDAAVDSMMRGATLPPFPADMPQSQINVSVPIHFSLDR